LVYVVGPSGAGKDSVMAWARERCAPGAGGPPVLFAHRYITRAATAGGENHVALSQAEFQARLDAGLFALHWDSHGLRYGVGCEIDLWLAAGCTVVVNGSRAYLDTAVRRYEGLEPVLVHVADAVLRERLRARGREDEDEIERRLERGRGLAACAHPRLALVDNGAELARAGRALLDILTGRAGWAGQGRMGKAG
jgi:ribose 1,5-bisphosphokinase